MVFESRHNGAPRDSESTDRKDTRNRGHKTVVDLSQKVLTQAEVSLLSKGLKFCPTLEKIDIYSLRKDIKEYVRRVRLREYFYSEQDDVRGIFQIFQRLEKSQVGAQKK